MKLWLINHFRVLPTDERFKKLTEDQIELLFISFISMPGDEDYKRAYIRKRTGEELASGLPREALRKMGYTDEQIKKIAEEVSSIA